MAKTNKRLKSFPVVTLSKCPSGIRGLDEITEGGLPQGRPTLVCGSAGCGKTLLGMEFLVRGATEYDEPGVFMTFEETEGDLIQNFTSLGFDIPSLVEQKKLAVDYVWIERAQIQETGEYDLAGLFIRLAMAIDQVKAKRVVLDTIEAIFSGFDNEGILRAEIRRLFKWLKEKGVTAIITAERGAETFSRHGLEEYVADCVILLDHRVLEQISTRRLRIVKYRGSTHGADEYPFLIHPDGISLLPITSIGLQHEALSERISTGIPRLDTMFGGKGYYRGSTVLVSGSAGVGKTSVAAHYADAACKRGERVLYLAFEESASQIIRNMKSIGIKLDSWAKKNLLKFHATRPTMYGLESHLTGIHRVIEEFKPSSVVIDPISNLMSVGNALEVKAMLMRLVDFLKANGITCLCTDLTQGQAPAEETGVGISSLMDTWILLRSTELDGERNRTLRVIKSRGMDHSGQVREFRLTDNGVDLVDVYLGAGGVPTGSARSVREAQDKAEALNRKQELDLLQRTMKRKKQLYKVQADALRAQFEAEEDELQRKIDQEAAREKALTADRSARTSLRKADFD